MSTLLRIPCFGGGILLWLPAGGGGGTLLYCGGGGGAVVVVSGSAPGGGGGGGGETEVCSAFASLVPHSGQNYWLSSTSAPQLGQNVILFQINPCQRRIKNLL